MKPSNNTEREVVQLSGKLPPLSDRQRKWALRMCISTKNAYLYRDRFARGSFYLVTTYKGWQILRYFQVKAKFRYYKLVDEKVYFKECMQQWMKDGKYIFLSKQRTMGYYTDAFCTFGKMEVRTHTMWGALGDPRNCGWDGVYYVSVQDKYKYALKDFKGKINFDQIFRAINSSSYNETLMRKDLDLWKICRYHESVFDNATMNAVKVTIRHGQSSYLRNSLWWDMIDALRYLKKDTNNPIYACPANLKEAHNHWLLVYRNKKKKLTEKMAKLRQIQEEKRMLTYMEAQVEREKENKKKAKALALVYVARRKKFFDLDITNGIIHVKALRSVEEFFEEGKEMCHCVFANGYYDVNRRPNCLILSAKVNERRMETLEIDLSSLKVVQCHGKFNQNSDFHQSILNLVNENMWQIEACM